MSEPGAISVEELRHGIETVSIMNAPASGTIVLTTAVTRDLHATLQAVAQERGQSLAALLRDGIGLLLQQEVRRVESADTDTSPHRANMKGERTAKTNDT